MKQPDRSNCEEIFTYIHDMNIWGNLYQDQRYPISSGFGNTEENTLEYRKRLRQYISNNDIKTVSDIGCGLWEFEHKEFDATKYVGVDCVKKVIAFNRERYNRADRQFLHADALIDVAALPDADLCIVKDVLQHLCNDYVIQLLEALQQKSKYVLLTHDCQQKVDNADVANGDYRPLSPDMAPLNQFLPKTVWRCGLKRVMVIGAGKDEFSNVYAYQVGGRAKADKTENVKVDDNENLLESCRKSNVRVSSQSGNGGRVLLAILARNKAHVLPKFLECIEDIDYDKKSIVVYINTNNNSDGTTEVLAQWTDDHKGAYAHVEFDPHENVLLHDTTTNPHTWSPPRFKVLGEIRNKSLRKTIEYKCDYYFVVDCDNFIEPCTLKDMIAEDKPIVAPMLTAMPDKNSNYSNFFTDITANGYAKYKSNYTKYLEREEVGTFEVPVVHCTYLIKKEYIPKLSYLDETVHHEFVVFSKCARENNISQYICNKKYYGCLVFFLKEHMSLEEERNELKGHPMMALKRCPN